MGEIMRYWRSPRVRGSGGGESNVSVWLFFICLAIVGIMFWLAGVE